VALYESGLLPMELILVLVSIKGTDAPKQDLSLRSDDAPHLHQLRHASKLGVIAIGIGWELCLEWLSLFYCRRVNFS
jgi:hypothetical protein